MAAGPARHGLFLRRQPDYALGIHISEYYHSLTCLGQRMGADHPGTPQKHRGIIKEKAKKQVKKRPGGEYIVLAVTQSYALSHNRMIDFNRQSSTRVGISLHPALYQIVNLDLPPNIPLPEQVEVFRHSLEEHGFAPLERWRWDIRRTDNGYQAIVCSNDWLQSILQRLQLPLRSVRYIGSSPEITPQPALSLSMPFTGPWLDSAELEQSVQTALYTLNMPGRNHV